MRAPGLPAVFRTGMALLSVGIVGGGFFFALRGTESAEPGSPLAPVRVETSAVSPATPRVTPTSSPPAPASAEPTSATVSLPEATATAAPPLPSAAAGAAPPQAPPAPQPPTPTPVPSVSNPPSQGGPDLPKYRDTEVLALAAGAVLPSGKTFRQCVEAPPSTEHWPTPVHLYYEGRGKWLVETHLSEVQVVFDEASGTFSPRNFAPPNAGCL